MSKTGEIMYVHVLGRAVGYRWIAAWNGALCLFDNTPGTPVKMR